MCSFESRIAWPVFDNHGNYADCEPLEQRILIALLTKGRSTVAQLIQNTSLGPRHIRNGLGVLIQQNLVYHGTSPDTRSTNYEANPTACYNIVRYGKILEAVESQYGSAERDLVQTLMLLGHAKVGDLDQAFEARRSHVNGYNNGVREVSSHAINSNGSLRSVLARLIQAEIIETVRPDSLRNPAEILHEMKTEATKAAPGEKMTSKVKAERENQALERFREFKDQSRSLKRQLDQTWGSAKRRKLENGMQRNGHNEDDSPPPLNVRATVMHRDKQGTLSNRRTAKHHCQTKP
jgi:DNA-directed RNA polymerase III subunit RPC3